MIWGINSPTFLDFVDAAQRVQPQDCLVYKDGRIGRKLPYEEDAFLSRIWVSFNREVKDTFSKTINATWSLYKKSIESLLPLNNSKIGTIWENFKFSIERALPVKGRKEIQGEALNRKTWAVFKRAVEKAFTVKRINWICGRYGFNWENMVGSGLPLERRYVEYFGVGAETSSSYNLLEILRQNSWIPWLKKSLSSRSVDEIYRLHQASVKCRYLGTSKDPSRVSGAPSLSHENFAPDYFVMDRQRCNLFRGIADLVSKDPKIPRLHPYYSRLCMGIISLLETEKKIRDRELVIPAPGPRDGELDYYKIYDIVSFGGMTAVALVPISDESTLKPIVAFRCTKQTLGQAEAIPSMLNDVELNIGESGYKAGKEALAKLVNDPKFTRGGKFNVLCYSLGGAHATYFMRDHWKNVADFVGFNFVGSEEVVVDSIARQINELPKTELPPSFYLYRNICDQKGALGDWVNKAGQKHVGCGVKHPNSRIQLVEWIVDDRETPTENVYDPLQVQRWLTIHGVRPMDLEREDELKSPFGPNWKYRYNIFRGHHLCTPRLDTYRRDGGLEDARLKFGHQVVYKVVSMVYSFLDFIFRAFGIEFFR